MTPITFILETVEALGDVIKPGVDALSILNAIKPLLIEFGMSPMILSDSQRAMLADRIHYALRRAKLIEGVDL